MKHSKHSKIRILIESVGGCATFRRLISQRSGTAPARSTVTGWYYGTATCRPYVYAAIKKAYFPRVELLDLDDPTSLESLLS